MIPHAALLKEIKSVRAACERFLNMTEGMVEKRPTRREQEKIDEEQAFITGRFKKDKRLKKAA